LFKSDDLQASIAPENHNDPLIKYDYRDSNNFMERAESLNVDGELSLSIMAGIIKLDGAGSYLTVHPAVAVFL
jgi:hypothetical protein